jgi:hypothetical protein
VRTLILFSLSCMLLGIGCSSTSVDDRGSNDSSGASLAAGDVLNPNSPACLFSFQCKDSVCRPDGHGNKLCLPKGGTGESCDDSNECQDGLVCRPDGHGGEVCLPKGGLGDSCDQASECEDDLICNENSVCAECVQPPPQCTGDERPSNIRRSTDGCITWTCAPR